MFYPETCTNLAEVGAECQKSASLSHPGLCHSAAVVVSDLCLPALYSRPLLLVTTSYFPSGTICSRVSMACPFSPQHSQFPDTLVTSYREQQLEGSLATEARPIGVEQVRRTGELCPQEESSTKDSWALRDKCPTSAASGEPTPRLLLHRLCGVEPQLPVI